MTTSVLNERNLTDRHRGECVCTWCVYIEIERRIIGEKFFISEFVRERRLGKSR